MPSVDSISDLAPHRLLFDQGIEPCPAAVMVQEPGRLTRLLVDGKAGAGQRTRATFFGDNDGAKLFVTWRPENSSGPAETVLADLGLHGVEP